MFRKMLSQGCKYAPVLALSPAEMRAIKELPEKDKDLILPIISLKGWVGSKCLENSLKKIKDVFGDRFWIADIDEDFLYKNDAYLLSGEFPRPVFHELERLLEPTNGYQNWVEFISNNKKSIPVIQLGNLSELEEQAIKLYSLGRGIVLRINLEHIALGYHNNALLAINSLGLKDVFVLYDIGTINKSNTDNPGRIIEWLATAKKILPDAIYSVTSTSFPSGFSGYVNGENTIYERMLFNKVKGHISNNNLIYSDYSSARSEKQNGGGGVPAPRIDYPLKDEWRFVRPESEGNLTKHERFDLYVKAAKQIIEKPYWNKGLFLWGTQMIALTSKGDKYGIDSPQRSTAVRINIHLHTQLHYDDALEELDTDDDWVD